MKLETLFTAEEQQILDRIAAEIQQSHQRPATPNLEKKLQRWATAVTRIEAGYRWPSYEYQNDVGPRDFLQEVFNATPPSVQTKLTAVMKPWDDRFIASTQDAPAILELTPPLAGAYWYLRVPRKLAGSPDVLDDWAVYYDGPELPASAEFFIDW